MTAPDVPTFGKPIPTSHEAAPTSPGAPPTPSPAPTPDGDVEAVPAASILDALRAELATDVTEAELVIEVPTRRDTAVRFSTEVAWEELTAWRKRASSKGLRSAANPEGVDLLRLAAIVVANRALAIVHKGTDVVGSDGEVLTFAHPELHAMTGADRAVDAVRAFYGRDGHVQTAAGMVLDAAGYGDELTEVDDADPTRPGR